MEIRTQDKTRCARTSSKKPTLKINFSLRALEDVYYVSFNKILRYPDVMGEYCLVLMLNCRSLIRKERRDQRGK